MNQSQWLHFALDAIFVIGSSMVLGFLYILLRNRRSRSSSTLALELFGVLLFSALLFYFSGLMGTRWPESWIEPVLKIVAGSSIFMASIALVFLLPRAIKFRDRELLYKAADELRQSKDRFERALRGASSGLWEWNIEEDVVWFSPRYRELLGYESESEFPNTLATWEKSVHPNDKVSVRQAVDRHLANHDDFEIEYRLRTKSGEYRWFSGKGIAIRDPSGKPFMISGSIQDIHERKNLQQATRKIDEYMLQKHKMESLGELAGGIAHEFNNLLQAIGGQLQFVAHGLPADSPAVADIGVANQLVDNAAQITRRLLAFGRQNNSKRQQVRPNGILMQLGAVLRPIINNHIHLNIKREKVLGRLLIDPISVQQALVNFCINARDAMPHGGTITITTKEAMFESADLIDHPGTTAGHFLAFVVSDTGHGIPLDVQKRLFEPFFSTKAPGAGSGLGLSIVEGIARENRGFVEFESELGVGTTFKLWLPVLKLRKKHHKSRPAKLRGKHQLTVLYVEDDRYVRRSIAQEFQDSGLRVALARGGDSALNTFEQRSQEIDVAVLDLSMPNMNGAELFRRLRLIKPELPVVFCTAYPAKLYAENLLDEPETYLVTKPFKFQSLWEKLEQAVLHEKSCETETQMQQS